MPSALEKLIPIIQPSRHPQVQKQKRRAKSRVYDEHYLPIAPSQIAPRHATITGRVADAAQITYSLDIGGVEISDVGLDEILEYVSAFELERFENAQFVEERELLFILKKEARQERQAWRQYKRQQQEQQIGSSGTSEDSSDDDVAEPVQTAVEPPAVGKHGRARPTYKHLYLQPQVRRRRKRDPATGELLSLSEDDGGFVTHAATQDVSVEESARRRRRKRDKATGELLPLSPKIAPQVAAKPKPEMIHVNSIPAVAGYVQDPDKRPRRRRHPITNELMPLGWTYDPTADDLNVSPGDTFKNLSITGHGQPSAKRARLENPSSTTRESSASLSSSGRQLIPSVVIDRIDRTTKNAGRASVIPPSLPATNVSDSDEAMIDVVVPSHARSSLTHPTMKRRSSKSSESSSPEVITLSSFQKPKNTAANPQARGKTSMLNPTMTPVNQSAGTSDDESDDGEFVIEGILHHRMSDPRTHLPEFGHKAIRLYQVKWEGYDEFTWESIESFPDRSIVQEYHQRVGLRFDDSLPSAVATSIGGSEKSTGKSQALLAPLSSSVDNSPTNNKQPANNKPLMETRRPPENKREGKAPLETKTHTNARPPTDNRPPTSNRPPTINRPPTENKRPTETKPPMENNTLSQPSKNSVSTRENVQTIEGSKKDNSSPPTPKNEYVVEAILGHHKSDPKTHPSGTGNKPTMLYHVKWEGYDELTWEPIESFPVRSIVLEYRERHGLHRAEGSSTAVKPKTSVSQGSQKKEQQRMQWNALMAASQKSGKSAQHLPGDDSSDI